MEHVSPTEILAQIVAEICSSTKAKYGSVYIQFIEGPVNVFSSVPVGQINHKEKNFVISALNSTLNSHVIDNFRVYFLPLHIKSQPIGCIALYFPKEIPPQHTLFTTIDMLLLSYSMFQIRNQIDNSLAKISQDIFISTASHEFKTPLTTVKLYADLIQKEAKADRSVPSAWGVKLYEQTTIFEQRLSTFISFFKQQERSTYAVPYIFSHLLHNIVAINALLFPHHIFHVEKFQKNSIMFDNNQEQLMSILVQLYTSIARSLTEPYTIHSSLSIKDQALNLQISLVRLSKEKKQTLQQKLNLDNTTTQLHKMDGDLRLQFTKKNGNTITVTLPFSNGSF